MILAGFAAQPQYQGKLKVVGKPFSEERYGVGIKKGDTELCGKINAALEKMVSDGAWEKALEDTVGKSGFKPDRRTRPSPTPVPDRRLKLQAWVPQLGCGTHVFHRVERRAMDQLQSLLSEYDVVSARS